MVSSRADATDARPRWASGDWEKGPIRIGQSSPGACRRGGWCRRRRRRRRAQSGTQRPPTSQLLPSPLPCCNDVPRPVFPFLIRPIPSMNKRRPCMCVPSFCPFYQAWMHRMELTLEPIPVPKGPWRDPSWSRERAGVTPHLTLCKAIVEAILSRHAMSPVTLLCVIHKDRTNPALRRQKHRGATKE